MSQLPLSFPLRSTMTFAELDPTGNEELITQIRASLHDPAFRAFWVWGPPGSGRTHLAQAAVQAAGRGAYLPCAEVGAAFPGRLEGLTAMALVALDDVVAAFGQRANEAAFVGLFQGLVDGGGTLVMTAPVRAQSVEFVLDDCRSRCGSAAQHELKGLPDDRLRQLIVRHASRRGLRLGGAVLDYWLVRAPRRVDVLLEQLERLDAAALAAQRPVTVPLIKSVLGL